MKLNCNGRQLDLQHPQVMGILNVTPDSFSDGGRFLARDAALRHAERMVADGAAIIDVGGESTRPGAQAIDEAEEIRRVVPVVEALVAELPVPISVDTSNPGVAEAAVRVGAGLINDVRALQRDGMLDMAAALNVPVCLMHMQGEPGSMQQAPTYADVVQEVAEFLHQRALLAEEAGIAPDHILLDPGFGFGKSVDHNLLLMRELHQLAALGYPLLVGVSRKTMVGQITGRPLAQRVHGSAALAAIAVANGAMLVRAHDVGPTVDAVRMAYAVRSGSGESES